MSSRVRELSVTQRRQVVMSREVSRPGDRAEFQRAMADLLRVPALCRHADEDGAFSEYALTEVERGRLRAIARHRGMVVNATLYRASRLVGIVRRLPATVTELGPMLREVFDAYLRACPDAEPEFDREALAFAGFVKGWLDDPTHPPVDPAAQLRAVLAVELERLTRA